MLRIRGDLQSMLLVCVCVHARVSVIQGERPKVTASRTLPPAPTILYGALSPPAETEARWPSVFRFDLSFHSSIP